MGFAFTFSMKSCASYSNLRRLADAPQIPQRSLPIYLILCRSLCYGKWKIAPSDIPATAGDELVQEQFDPRKHIRNVSGGPELNLLGPDGTVLPGIAGVIGASARLRDAEIGVDRIIMKPGSEFEMHTHPGAHILYVLKAHGYICIDNINYELAEGDTVYVPADFAHAVRTNPLVNESFDLLSFGVPHVPLESAKRMAFVQ